MIRCATLSFPLWASRLIVICFRKIPMAHWFEEGMSTKRFYQKDEERNLLSFNEEVPHFILFFMLLPINV